MEQPKHYTLEINDLISTPTVNFPTGAEPDIIAAILAASLAKEENQDG